MPVYKDEKVKENPWYFVIEVGENGKRSRKKVRGFKGEREAKKAMTDMQKSFNDGENVNSSKMKFKLYLKSYLDNKKTSVRSSTMKTYDWLINKYVIPALGEIEIGKLTPIKIQQFYNEVVNGDTITGENIQKIHTLIKDSLNIALRWGYVTKNVASLVDRPKAQKGEIHVWDIQESNQFLKVSVESRFHIAYLLALTTGMRQAEILGLRWKDVSFANGSLQVVQTLSHDGKTLIAETKTKAGSRKISVPAEVITELKTHKVKIAEERLNAGDMYVNNDLVVCTNVGTPVIPRNLLRSLYVLTEKAKVPKIKFHEMRHTHATLLLKQNVHPKIVSERLGHADVRITLDTYSHLLPDMQKDAASEFGKLFFAKEDEPKIEGTKLTIAE